MATTTSSVAAAPMAPTALFNRKPFYTLLTVTGFGLLILAGFVILFIGLQAGDLAETGPFVLFFLVPGLLGMFLPWRFARWGAILPILLALALSAMILPFMSFSLLHPEGGLEFVLALLFVAGAALGIIGGVVSTVQGFRRTARPGATPLQRRGYGVGLVLLVGLIAASFIISALARTTLAADVRAGATEVQMKDFNFTTRLLRVSAGETVRLAVRNDDTALHTFTLPDAGVDIVIPAGAERLVEFTAPAAGSYTWYCVPHTMLTDAGPEGMVGTLTVAP